MLVTDKTPVCLFNKSQYPTPPPTSKVTPSHQNLVFDISYRQKLWQKATIMGGGVRQAGVCIYSIGFVFVFVFVFDISYQQKL